MSFKRGANLFCSTRSVTVKMRSPQFPPNVEFKMLPPSHVLCSLFLGITYVGAMWILST